MINVSYVYIERAKTLLYSLWFNRKILTIANLDKDDKQIIKT